MTLAPRTKFNLTRQLAYLPLQSNDIEPFLRRSGLAPIGINYAQATIKIWEEVLSYYEAIGTNDIISLTNAVLKVYVEPEIESINEELKNSYLTKLSILSKAIVERKCILFIGPGALLCEDPENNHQLTTFNFLLAKELIKELKLKGVYYSQSQSNNLSYIAQRYTQLPGYYFGDEGVKAKELFEKLLTNNSIDTRVYSILAQLPFKLIINTNIDEELNTNILNQKPPGVCETTYYNVNNSKQNITNFLLNNKTTSIYNIFGSYKDHLSLLLTERQLLSFVKRVIEGNPALEQSVRLEFDETKHYIFLGFDFDQWYMKIFLEMILRIVKQQNRSFSIFSSTASGVSVNREFFEEEFKLYFIDDSFNTFLNKLLKAYHAFRPD